MRAVVFFFLVLFFDHASYGQMFTKWITSFAGTHSWTSVEQGILDSNSNYYSYCMVGMDTSFIRKIDSSGTVVWETLIAPDSIIPDTDYFDGTLINLTSGQDLIAASKFGFINLLEKLNSSGTIIFKRVFYEGLLIDAFPVLDNRIYLMMLDDSNQAYTHLYILDSLGNTVRHDTLTHGGVYTTPAIKKDENGNVFAWYSTSNNYIIVYHYYHDQLIDSLLITGGGSPNGPGFYVDKSGNRYVSRNGGGLIKYDTAWVQQCTIGTGEIQDLKFDSIGNIFLLNSINAGNMPVKKFDPNGNLLWSYSMNQPYGISHYPNSLVLDSRGCPLISGKKFDVISNGQNHNDKVFVARLSQTGHLDAYIERYFHGTTSAYASGQYINSKDQLFYFIAELDSNYYTCLNTRSSPNISGQVFYDSNGNCIHDTNEATLPFFTVSVNPSSQFAQTDNSGKFGFQVPDGNYIVSCGMPANWQFTCPPGTASVTVSNGIMTGNADFGLQLVTGLNDLAIDFSHAMVRANRDITVLIHYQNLGSVVINGTVHFDYDSCFSFISSNPSPDTVTSAFLAWNFSSFFPGESRYIYFTLHSHSLPTGTPFSNTASIISLIGDVHPGDNSQSEDGVVAGSFDPNEKLVVPKGSGPEGFISTADSAMCYKIIFQNTGNDTAFFIQVIDTLDQNLDPLSFRMGAMSPAGTYNLSGCGVLRFVFDPVSLPDSATDEPGSYGYINYFIRQKLNLPLGSTIQNKADIYFDYNPRVTTDTTLNTINSTINITSVQKENLHFYFYPNPSTNQIYIRLNRESSNESCCASIFSSDGRLIRMVQDIKNNSSLDLSGIIPGHYFIRIQMKNIIETKSLIIIPVK